MEAPGWTSDWEAVPAGRELRLTTSFSSPKGLSGVWGIISKCTSACKLVASTSIIMVTGDIMVTEPQTRQPTHRQDRLQYTAPQLAHSVITSPHLDTWLPRYNNYISHVMILILILMSVPLMLLTSLRSHCYSVSGMFCRFVLPFDTTATCDNLEERNKTADETFDSWYSEHPSSNLSTRLSAHEGQVIKWTKL